MELNDQLRIRFFGNWIDLRETTPAVKGVLELARGSSIGKLDFPLILYKSLNPIEKRFVSLDRFIVTIIIIIVVVENVKIFNVTYLWKQMFRSIWD